MDTLDCCEDSFYITVKDRARILNQAFAKLHMCRLARYAETIECEDEIRKYANLAKHFAHTKNKPNVISLLQWAELV